MAAITRSEKRFLHHLKLLITHDGGSAFNWELSIFAMFNHMREFSDPMDFRDPFVLVGILSLLTHSNACTISKYKSWCRKNHVPLPLCDTLSTALDISQQHAQVLASTNQWTKQQQQQNDEAVKKQQQGKENLGKNIFITSVSPR
tara:strand:+ start:553 stop:987 length:435 start_codon:yes stop_codon:yes gene_type:complete